MLRVKNKDKHKGGIERMLKELKGKVIRTRQMRKLNEGRYYEKPSERNRKVKNKAIYVNNKFNKD